MASPTANRSVPTPARPGAKSGVLAGRRAACLLLALALAPLFAAAPAALRPALAQQLAAQDESDYRLNPGDVIEISVWKEPELQREVLLLPDGNIAFPLVGTVKAAGRTPGEIQSLVEERLTRYFPEPVVTVSILRVAGNKLYVTGQVNQPGQFTVDQPVDVLQAIALAGGLTAFADEDDIYVLRRAQDGSQRALAFDYDDVSDGSDLSTNIVLQQGDVVVVPTAGLF